MIPVRSRIGGRRYVSRLRVHRSLFPACTALLDLFFLLLFFILAASSVVRLSGIPVELPQVRAPYVNGLGKLIVTITAPDETGKCRIFFRDNEVSIMKLREELSRKEGNTVIIRADRKVPAEVLDEVISLAGEVQLTSCLAVQPLDAKPGLRIE